MSVRTKGLRHAKGRTVGSRTVAPTKKCTPYLGCISLVRMTGLEPARSSLHKILSLMRLPIPPHPHLFRAYVFYHKLFKRANEFKPFFNIFFKIFKYGFFALVLQPFYMSWRVFACLLVF